jgi:hypothetical protein
MIVARTGLINHLCRLAGLMGLALLLGLILAHCTAEAIMKPLVCAGFQPFPGDVEPAF